MNPAAAIVERVNPPVATDRLFGRWSFLQVAIALFAATFLLNAFGCSSVPLLHNDEARFAEAAREMRERHDFIVPYFNGEYRFDKPPLVYWCQVGAMMLFGENEFAVRLHSIFSGAALAVVLLGFGSRVASFEVGFWAAIIFSTSLRVMMQAKGATADMLLTLFVTLAFWAGWELIRNADPENPIPKKTAWRSGWWWLFYFSLSLAFLAKGPVGWMPLLALAVFKWWAEPVSLNRQFCFELGLPLMLALVCLWGVPALMQTHGEFFRVGIGGHVVARMTRGYDGQGAPNVWAYIALLPFYFVYVFAMFVGWSTWFPWCYKQLRAEKFGGHIERFLLSGILVIFVIFSLGWTRIPHYVLPAFPLIALLFALLWRRAGRSRKTVAWVAACLVIVALALIPVATYFLPKYNPGKDLVEKCAPHLAANSAFGAVDLDQASLVWYFRGHVHSFRQLLKPDEAPAFMAQTGPRFCVMERDLADQKFRPLPATWHRIDADREGYYSGTNKMFFLTVLIKP